MEEAIGKDYQEGLTRLKNLSENQYPGRRQ